MTPLDDHRTGIILAVEVSGLRAPRGLNKLAVGAYLAEIHIDEAKWLRSVAPRTLDPASVRSGYWYTQYFLANRGTLSRLPTYLDMLATEFDFDDFVDWAVWSGNGHILQGFREVAHRKAG